MMDIINSQTENERTSSFEKLKRAATCIEDIESWFLQNRDVFVSPSQGEVTTLQVWVHPRRERDHMLVGGPKSPKVDEIFYEEEPEHILGMCINLYIKSTPEGKHPFLSNAGLQNTRVSTGTLQEQWTMPIALSEWSFLVALSTSSYLLNKTARGLTSENDYFFMKIQKDFLVKNLPEHFPGITLDNIQALHAAGILENIGYAGITSFLFANRTSAKVELHHIDDLPLALNL